MSNCRTCGAAIRWARTEKDDAIPVDPEPHPEGNLILEEDPESFMPRARVHRPLFDKETTLHRSHFVTCPDAAKHRKPRRRA